MINSVEVNKKGGCSSLVFQNFEVIEDLPIKCVNTSDFAEYPYPFKKFNRLQTTIVENKRYKKDVNVVMGASTSSGKTIAAELFMWQVLKQGKKVLYISPLKSLTQEKYEDWTQTFGDTYKICIMTGDYLASPLRIKELGKADIITMTSEMVDSRTRKAGSEASTWISQVGLVILDESHIISTNRGHAVEVGLMRFSKLNPHAKILFLSATLPNVVDFAVWLYKLNRKRTIVINSHWRPVTLNWHFIEFISEGKYQEQVTNKIKTAISIIKKKPKEKFLCFVHDKNTGRQLVYWLGRNGIKSFFHNAELSLADRLSIEKDFSKRKGLRVLVATSTLAWGSVEKDTNILMSSGYQKPVQHLKKGDSIVSYNEKTGDKQQDFIAGINKYYPTESYHIELEDGTILKVDYKHPFYVREGSKLSIVEAQNLKDDDDLVLNKELFKMKVSRIKQWNQEINSMLYSIQKLLLLEPDSRRIKKSHCFDCEHKLDVKYVLQAIFASKWCSEKKKFDKFCKLFKAI